MHKSQLDNNDKELEKYCLSYRTQYLKRVEALLIAGAKYEIIKNNEEKILESLRSEFTDIKDPQYIYYRGLDNAWREFSLTVNKFRPSSISAEKSNASCIFNSGTSRKCQSFLLFKKNDIKISGDNHLVQIHKSFKEKLGKLWHKDNLSFHSDNLSIKIRTYGPTAIFKQCCEVIRQLQNNKILELDFCITEDAIVKCKRVSESHVYFQIPYHAFLDENSIKELLPKLQ